MGRRRPTCYGRTVPPQKTVATAAGRSWQPIQRSAGSRHRQRECKQTPARSARRGAPWAPRSKHGFISQGEDTAAKGRWQALSRPERS
jgi:hypothetical protein